MLIMGVILVIFIEVCALGVLGYCTKRSILSINKFRILVYIMFSCYAVCVVITTFGIRDYTEEAGVNLIPFNAIGSLITELINSANSWGISNIPHEFTFMKQGVFNLFGNILLLLPLGYFAPLLSEKKVDSLWKAALIGTVASVLIEVSQWYMHRGFFDIDDVILNTSGCVLGWLCYSKWLRAAER